MSQSTYDYPRIILCAYNISPERVWLTNVSLSQTGTLQPRTRGNHLTQQTAMAKVMERFQSTPWKQDIQ